MKRAFVGIGSNLGEKRKNCMEAVERLKEITGCHFIRCSGWYLTSPVGKEDQDWFVNGVACLDAEIQARDLLAGLLSIEARMGRIRMEKWGPRVIDLDLLLFGMDIVNQADLKIPHPLLHVRRFVLVPLAEVAPDVIHPVFLKPVLQILKEWKGEGQDIVPVE